MFNEVEHLKSRQFQKGLDVELKGLFLELVRKHDMSVDQIWDSIFLACRRKCQFNFIDHEEYGQCHDIRGEHIAFSQEAIAEAYSYDKERITCGNICEHGCCAFINHLAFSIISYLMENEHNGTAEENTRRTEERVSEGA